MGVHGGHGFGDRNEASDINQEFAMAYDLAIAYIKKY